MTATYRVTATFRVTATYRMFFILLATVPAAFAEPTSFSTCDVNRDGVSNIADVQSETNQALGIFAANDLNNDGIVNVADVQIVINAALGLGCTAYSGPTITDFNPKSGPLGTLVSIVGTNLAGTTQVSVSQQGGGLVNPPPATVSASAVAFVVPAGAVSGPIKIVTSSGTATSAASFTVTPSSGFTLTATPPSANLIQGQSVAFAVTLASSNGFNQLAQLSVSGVPAGVTVAFQPASITAGQTSVLTLTAPANQPIATSSLSISAAATVDGLPVTQSATPSLSVVAPTTTIMGRTVVANALETPLAGVTITTLGKDGNGNTTGCMGQSAVSDAAGNFALTNLPLACTGPQLIGFNGTTATAPPGQYAGVNLVFTLVSGQVTASAVLVHLPRIDNVETFQVTQNSSSVQNYSFATIPGLSVTVYANTTFTTPDGTQPNPFPLAAVQVPVDRLPDNKPNVPTMIRAFIVAFQPANATTNQPVAVYFPNTLNTPPGTDMALMTLDPTHGQMVPYGTGAVSADGTQIVPDADPAHPGHLYGLVHFDWHGPMPGPSPGSGPGPGPDCSSSCCAPSPGGDPTSDGGGPPGSPGGPDSPAGPQTGDPVDLASGLQIVRAMDIAIRGPRGSILINRVYRTLSTNQGPFGIGSGYNYGYQLGTAGYVRGQGMINLVVPNGNQYPFSVQPNGTLTNSTTPAYSDVVITSPAANMYNLRFKNGITLQFQSPPTGSLIAYLNSITDANGNTVTLAHGNSASPDQVTQVTDPVGRSLTLAYDGSDRIVSVTDPIGRVVSYTYNPQGTLATVTDPAGGVSRYAYDSQNRLTEITDARGVVMAQDTYDANGRVIQQIQADGGVIRIAYTLINPLAPTSPVMTTAVTDPLDNITTYRFDPTGLLLGVTDPTGQTRVFVHDPQHNNLVTSVTGGGRCPICGNTTIGNQTFTYDANGNTATITDSLGNTSAYSYEPTFNRVTSITDALGNVFRYGYDAHGNILSATDPNGNTKSYTYNSFGQMTKATNALGQATSFSYDGFGNKVAVTNELGATHTYAYDSVSRPIEAVSALGRKTANGYDVLDRLLTRTSPQGNTLHLTYDLVGDFVSWTDENGNTTSFVYDAMQRLVSRTDPRGKSDAGTRDLNGNLVKYIDRRGQASTFVYDPLNRLTSQTYQDSTIVRRTYDSNGRLIQVTDSAFGSGASTYELAGHLVASASPFGIIRDSFDADGRVATRQVGGQPSLMYSYDPAGNPLSVSMPQAVVGFSYDANNRLIKLVRSDAVLSGFAYDSAGHLLSMTHSGGPGAPTQLTYSYDAEEHRTLFTTNAIQPQAVTNMFDSSNRLVQSGPVSYTYDDNGNLATSSDATGVTAYTWDSRNRLGSISAPSGQKTALIYDPAGNLVSQVDSGPSLALTQDFVLDDIGNVAYVGRSSGDSLSVLSGRAQDQQLAVVHTSGQIEYGLTDAQNSAILTVDQSGNRIASFSYEPFGKTAANASYPFQYTGRIPITGNLYNYRARNCDTGVGRFISQDPLGIGSGDSLLYKYGGNDPTDRVDPSGLLSCTETCNIAKDTAQGECAVWGYLSGAAATPATGFAVGVLCALGVAIYYDVACEEQCQAPPSPGPACKQ